MSAHKEQFRKAMEHRGIQVGAGEGPQVERISPTTEIVKDAKKWVEDFVSAELEKRLEDRKIINRKIDEILTPYQDELRKEVSTPKEGALRKAQQTIVEARARHIQAQSPQSFITVGPGTTVLGPPWENFFNPNPPNFPYSCAYGTHIESNRVDVFSRDTFHGVIGGNGCNGVASSGLGFFINAPNTRFVSIRPGMYYDYEWSDNSNWFVSATTLGGLGVFVFRSGSGSPFIDWRWTLWDHTAYRSDGADAQSGYLTNYLPNGQVGFMMEAGITYLIWCWIWGYSDYSGIIWSDIFGNDYGSVSDFRMAAHMNFVVIES